MQIYRVAMFPDMSVFHMCNNVAHASAVGVQQQQHEFAFTLPRRHPYPDKVRTELGSARHIAPSVLHKFPRKGRQKIKFRSILDVFFIKKLKKHFAHKSPRVFRPKRPWRPEPLCTTTSGKPILYHAPNFSALMH
jgi:hypothetical protein